MPVKSNLSRQTWVAATLRRLSLEEKVGQLIMPAFRGVYLNRASSEFKNIEHQILENHVGGFILFAGDVLESAYLIDQMQARSKVPLLVGSDFERGASFRIRSTVSFPWNMAIGATGSEDWAYLQGKITAQEARAMGVNWIFAPVLDVNNNPGNPVINIRSYGEDPELVARLGAAFLRGAQKEGVLATGKHFPGHGNTDVDSHLTLPVIHSSREQLEKTEFIPFKRAIESGVSAIMTAHVSVPSLEPRTDVPATLSEVVIGKVLQEDLGFSKLVVTDSFSMAGLGKGYWLGDAAVRAIRAGVDMILDPPSPDVVFRALVEAFQTGELSEERLNQSVKKILQAKAGLGLHKPMRLDLVELQRVVNLPSHQEQARQIAEESMTLLKDSDSRLPIDVRRVDSVRVFLVLGRDAQEDTAIFQQELRRRIEKVTFIHLSAETADGALKEALQQAGKDGLTLCAVFARLVTGTGVTSLPENLAGWMKQISQLRNPPVVISLGNPYVIQQFSIAPVYLCTFSNAEVSQAAAVKALFGEIPIQGKTPVSIPGIAELYAGLHRPRLEMKLEALNSRSEQRDDSKPGSAAVRPERDTRIDGHAQLNMKLSVLDRMMEDSIRGHAFPGAALAVGYQGQLVYQKAFGRLDYSARSPGMTVDTLFDLASLTKVVATTTLAMQLVDQGQLSLDSTLGRYYPFLHGQDKEKITIRHLLTHSSGLSGHLPLYRDTRGRHAFVDRILKTPLEYQPGTRTVYSDLGIILLGDILEKLTAKTLDVAARERIFTPLHLTQTLFKPGSKWKKLTAPTEKDPWRGRVLQGEVHDENAYAMGGVAAHAGLFGTTSDLAVFSQMLLNGGIYDHRRIVRRSTLDLFTRRQNLPPGSSRALGWDTPSEGGSSGQYFSNASFGHTGFTGTSLWIDPTRQLFVVLLTNRVYPSRENEAIRAVRRDVADAVVKAIEE